jgi:hypothetical protein
MILADYMFRHIASDKICKLRSASAAGFLQLQHLQLPTRAKGRGTSIANCTSVALKSYAVAGGTGAPPVIAKLREATDRQNNKLKGMRQRGLRHPL